jgi:hypothetical protein
LEEYSSGMAINFFDSGTNWKKPLSTLPHLMGVMGT